STFGAPRLLGRSFELPTLLAQPDGGVTVVWNDQGVVRAMTRSRGGAFGAPVELGGDEASRVSAAVGDDGRVVVAWGDYDHGIRALRVSAGRAAVDKPVAVFGTGRRPLVPEVGVDHPGLATNALQPQDDEINSPEQFDPAGPQWPAAGHPGAPRYLTSVDPR